MAVAGLLAVPALVVTPSRASALVVPLDRAAIARALELARWPHTDQDRARFHTRYIVRIAGPAVNQVSVDTIEVVTEFRRMELIAEAHARLNDTFARGGAIREAEEALQPYRGRLSIVAHLRLGPLAVGLPDIDVAVAEPGGPRALDTRRTPIYAHDGTLIGGDAEAVFSSASIGQTVRTIVGRLGGAELARATIDFRALE